MRFNRMSAYLEDAAAPTIRESGPSRLNTVTTPPANFAAMPAGLSGPLPALSALWQELLSPKAYEAANGAVEAAARAANRARWS